MYMCVNAGRVCPALVMWRSSKNWSISSKLCGTYCIWTTGLFNCIWHMTLASYLRGQQVKPVMFSLIEPGFRPFRSLRKDPKWQRVVQDTASKPLLSPEDEAGSAVF